MLLLIWLVIENTDTMNSINHHSHNHLCIKSLRICHQLIRNMKHNWFKRVFLLKKRLKRSEMKLRKNAKEHIMQAKIINSPSKNGKQRNGRKLKNLRNTEIGKTLVSALTHLKLLERKLQSYLKTGHSIQLLRRFLMLGIIPLRRVKALIWEQLKH